MPSTIPSEILRGMRMEEEEAEARGGAAAAVSSAVLSPKTASLRSMILRANHAAVRRSKSKAAKERRSLGRAKAVQARLNRNPQRSVRNPSIVDPLNSDTPPSDGGSSAAETSSSPGEEEDVHCGQRVAPPMNPVFRRLRAAAAPRAAASFGGGEDADDDESDSDADRAPLSSPSVAVEKEQEMGRNDDNNGGDEVLFSSLSSIFGSAEIEASDRPFSAAGSPTPRKLAGEKRKRQQQERPVKRGGVITAADYTELRRSGRNRGKRVLETLKDLSRSEGSDDEDNRLEYTGPRPSSSSTAAGPRRRAAPLSQPVAGDDAAIMAAGMQAVSELMGVSFTEAERDIAAFLTGLSNGRAVRG